MRPGGCALCVGAEAGTGRHWSFRLPTLRFEIQHRPTCPMDRAGQILLINLYTRTRHTPNSLIRCAQRGTRATRGHISVVIFATKTTLLYNSEHTTSKLSYGPNYPQIRVSLEQRQSLRGGKVARAEHGTLACAECPPRARRQGVATEAPPASVPTALAFMVLGSDVWRFPFYSV